MLSSTSVSSIGNIHRRVIVFFFFFPFCTSEFRFSVVQRKEPRWRQRDLDGGWIFPLQMNTVQGSEGLLSDGLRLASTKGSRSIVHTSDDAGWMLDTDPSTWTGCLWRRAQKAEAKKVRSKWFIFLVLADEICECSFFPPLELSTLYDRRRSSVKVRVWRYLRCWVLNWPKPQTGIFAQVLSDLELWRVSVPAEMPCAPFFCCCYCCCCCWKGCEKIHFVFLWSSRSCRVSHVQAFRVTEELL